MILNSSPLQSKALYFWIYLLRRVLSIHENPLQALNIYYPKNSVKSKEDDRWCSGDLSDLSVSFLIRTSGNACSDRDSQSWSSLEKLQNVALISRWCNCKVLVSSYHMTIFLTKETFRSLLSHSHWTHAVGEPHRCAEDSESSSVGVPGGKRH